MQSQHQYLEIEQALTAFVAPGSVFEIRLLHGHKKRTDSGYFDSPSAAATAIAALNDPYMGIYFTPNPVVPDLAARAYNRINAWAQLTTMDPDILERRWLLIDVDPRRPTGISSTDAELDSAFKVARRIANMLELEGWPRPHINASGNGAHVMYAMKEPNNEFIRDEIAKFLKTLSARFSNEACAVDVVNYNAARIWRLPGTWARKGDNVPARPHRKAHLLELPVNPRLVSIRDIATFNSANEHLVPQTKGTPTNTLKSKGEYPEDERKYKGLNEQAMNRMGEWVQTHFPAAREYKQGYRVSSADLGLTYEEDLTIHPWPLGIKYFGVADQGDATEGRRTPIGLLAELLYLGDKTLAARKLADTLKAPLTEFDTSLINPQIPVASAAQAASLPGTETARQRFDFSRVPNVQGLTERSFAEQTWIIKDVLPTGNIMLAARPKMRKTFLALQLCMAICEGGKFLDWQCERGEALLLGLEDNERRIKDRIKLLNMFRFKVPDLSGFRYFTGGVDISPTTGRAFVSDPAQAAQTYSAFPRGEAGVEALDQYLDMYPKTKIIVIDTLAHFRQQSNERDIYQRDVDSIMPLTRLAARRKVLIMPVHHEKKGLASAETGDFMEDASGTSGITGSVDGVISIKGQRGVQEENEARKLLISGRDIPRDLSIDMAFDAQRGGWIPAVRQDAATAILELLSRHPFVNQMEFASLLPSLSRARISQVLTQLKYDGKITQGKYGYSLVRLPN